MRNNIFHGVSKILLDAGRTQAGHTLMNIHPKAAKKRLEGVE